MLRVAMSNEPDRDKRQRARGGARPAARRAPEPGLPRRGADRPRGRARARRAELLRALQALRLPARRARRRVPRRCSTRRRSSGSAKATSSSARGSGSGSTRRGRGTSSASSARPSSTSSTRPTRCCPRSRRRSPTSASTSARRRTSTSTSRRGRAKSPRAFCAPIEVPGKVMLVIQPIGGKDDWEALFHEAGHTEHYAHTNARPADGGASGSATWRSPRAGRC